MTYDSINLVSLAGSRGTKDQILVRLSAVLHAMGVQLSSQAVNQFTIDGNRGTRETILLRLIAALRVVNVERAKRAEDGTPFLASHSSVRGRMIIGGTFFRSVEYGLSANQILVTAVEDGAEGLFVVQHTVLKPDEMLAVSGMSLPSVVLSELVLNWDQEIRVHMVGGVLRAELYGIRWQIGGGETVLQDLGQVRDNRMFSVPGTCTFMVTVGTWPTGGVLYLRPRQHRYPLVGTSYTDPLTSVVSTGWDISALRVSLGGSDWVIMPARGADANDHAVDDTFLSAFDLTALQGGDGLPATPAGLYTGPAPTLIHLNYMDDPVTGQMKVFNKVYQWQGETTAIGTWQGYST